ncbi:MAG: dipicolinate synthase subunit B [Solirubrobacterales bacterium]
MDFTGITVGLVITGSHCTIGSVLSEVESLREAGAQIIPVLSYSARYTDNRFYRADDLAQAVERVTGNDLICTIPTAEPIGPGKMFDVLLLAPCTGNTMAKLANGITDTPALMAVKAQLRNQRPVVIAVSTNDALGLNAKNLGILINAKHIYFVPFRQDDPEAKPTSLVANMALTGETIAAALKGKQLQPMVLSPGNKGE